MEELNFEHRVVVPERAGPAETDVAVLVIIQFGQHVGKRGRAFAIGLGRTVLRHLLNCLERERLCRSRGRLGMLHSKLRRLFRLRLLFRCHGFGWLYTWCHHSRGDWCRRWITSCRCWSRFLPCGNRGDQRRQNRKHVQTITTQHPVLRRKQPTRLPGSWQKESMSPSGDKRQQDFERIVA